MQEYPMLSLLFRIVSDLFHGLQASITDEARLFLGIAQAPVPECEVLDIEELGFTLDGSCITMGAMVGAVGSNVVTKAQDMACHLAGAHGVVLYWDLTGGLFWPSERLSASEEKRLLCIGETNVKRGLKIINSLIRDVHVHAVFVEGRYLSRDFSKPTVHGTQRTMVSKEYEIDRAEHTFVIQRFFEKKSLGKRPTLIWADTFDDMPHPQTLKRVYQAQACQWVVPLP